MAGWHSLSGYLFFRTGGGISLLKTRKRVWCVLEESQSQLLYYRSEEDVRAGKSPLGNLSLIGAAISLDLDNNNQFIILSNNKEHLFTAENHESMMIWLLGLQARRDLNGSQGTDDADECLLKPRLRRSCDESGGVNGTSAIDKASTSMTRRKQTWHCSARAVESLDSGLLHYRSKGVPDNLERSRSLPPVFEAVECPPLATRCTAKSSMSKSLEGRLSKDSGIGLSSQSWRFSTVSLDNQHKILKELCQEESISSDDEVFKEMLHSEMNGFHDSPLHSSIMNSRVEEEDAKLETGKQEEYVNGDQNESKEVGSCSSLSVSSDSAIDKGETSSELASRLLDLEKELISTKCELAKVMNRQAGLQELLAQRDDAIRFLEGRLDTSNSVDKSLLGKSSKMPPVRSEKELQERLRILQNQNRFLNEEVKKLAKLRQTDRSTFYQQEDKVKALEAEIEKWRLDYVSLIQSSIRFSGCDTIDDAELVLFGGDRHKRKIQKLLEEARSVNPSLPTYESLANGEVHVDSYGFKHVFEDACNGLLLHYLCQELTLHYLMQAGSYEEHQKKWTQFMRLHGKSMASHLKDMKCLCRGGIPDRFRSQVWHQLVYWQVRDVMNAKGPHYYRNLCNMLPDSPLAARYRKQISLDLMRTMPNNMKFSSQGCKGVMDLQDVLLAYCVHNPTVGYCQGMNFIVGLALIFMDAQDAFWTLVAVTEKYFPCHYFDQNLIGAQSDQQVLKDLLAEKLPKLSRHLESIDIEISTVTLNWFLAIFFDAVPFQTLIRIWDCFLLEGPKVLFRFALAILKLHEKEILLKTDTISIMRHLKAAAKLTYDADGLIKVAFDGIKPFSRRKDISTKQACYLNTLKEQNKKKELQRLAYTEREHMYMTMESGNYQNLGAAVVIEDGKVWLTYGEQNSARLCKVTCEEGVMYDLGMNFDSRVMCMENAPDNTVLMGTLSWMLYAYDSKTRERLWELLLHDAVLSLCCFEDEDSMLVRTFAGLADGTLAVTEQQDMRKVFPSNDVLYIPIGQAPISCLLLLGDFLWCASGNSVNIIQARTLDPIDNFNVSINPYDHILSMVPGDFGIWVTLRGSSILELWDPKNLNCKLLYDTRTDRYPQLRKEDDTYFNRARITSIMDLGSTVWVGTGEGNLIIYEIMEHLNLKTPTEVSPTTENGTGQIVSSPGNSKSSSRGKSVIKSNSSPVLCSKQIRKRSPKPRLSGDENQPALPVKADLLSKIFNSSEAESTGSLTPKNSSPRHPALCEKKRNGRTPMTIDGKEMEAVSDQNGLDLQIGEMLIGKIELDSDESTYYSDKENLGRPLYEVHQNKVPCTIDTVNKDKNDGVDYTQKRTKAVRPTNLLPTKRSQWSAKRKDIASQDNLDCLFKQLIDVKRRGSLDNAMKNFVQKSKSCECLTYDNSFSNGLDTKSEDSDQKDDCGFLIDCSVSKTGQSPVLGEECQKEALQDTISCDSKAMSRHHKVNSWLSSIDDSQTCDSDNEEMKENGLNTNGEILCTESSINVDSLDRETKCKETLSNGTTSAQETPKSESASNTCTSVSNSDGGKERRSSRVSEIMTKVLRQRKSSTQDTSSESDRPAQIPKSNAMEAKYHLDFSEMQVLTDVEGSRRSSQVRRESSEFSSEMESRLIAQMSRLDNWSLNNSKSSISSSPKILELMQTPSLASRHQSVGRVSRELVPGDLSTASPRSSMDQRVADFLRTPSISSRPSSVWSSFENISTPSVKDQDFIGRQFANMHSLLVHTESSNSLSSMAEALCVVELSMEVKVKIADKPVRGFLKTRNCGEPSILSFTGCYGDDESVLKWRKEPNEQFWTNEPVLEICPKTKLTRLPSYMRGRLSSTSSQASTKSFHSVSSQPK